MLLLDNGDKLSQNISFFRFLLYLPDRQFYKYSSRPTRWTHVVLNYIGPNNGQGIRIYYDGTEVASDSTTSGDSKLAGDGRIVVGRAYTNLDEDYASVQVDELIFFDAALTSAEVQSIFNSA